MDEKRQILFMQVRILKMASEKLKLSSDYNAMEMQ